MTKRHFGAILAAFALALTLGAVSVADWQAGQSKTTGLRFEIDFPADMSATALDGRVLLIVARTNERERLTLVRPGRSPF